MRALLLVLGTALAGLGAWWLLRGEAAPGQDLEGNPGTRAAEATTVPEPVVLQAPRVGVRGGPQDRVIAADPEAGPWETFVLRLPGKAEDSLTGAVLLEAIGERLYVRARTPEELEALRTHVFQGLSRGASLTLGAAVVALEAAGWKVGVRDPLLVFRPAGADEQARAREAAGEPGR